MLVGTDVCVRVVFVWEENGVPGGNPFTVYSIPSRGWVAGIWTPSLGLYFLDESDVISLLLVVVVFSFYYTQPWVILS